MFRSKGGTRNAYQTKSGKLDTSISVVCQVLLDFLFHSYGLGRRAYRLGDLPRPFALLVLAHLKVSKDVVGGRPLRAVLYDVDFAVSGKVHPVDRDLGLVRPRPIRRLGSLLEASHVGLNSPRRDGRPVAAKGDGPRSHAVHQVNGMTVPQGGQNYDGPLQATKSCPHPGDLVYRPTVADPQRGAAQRVGRHGHLLAVPAWDGVGRGGRGGRRRGRRRGLAAAARPEKKGRGQNGRSQNQAARQGGESSPG